MATAAAALSSHPAQIAQKMRKRDDKKAQRTATVARGRDLSAQQRSTMNARQSARAAMGPYANQTTAMRTMRSGSRPGQPTWQETMGGQRVYPGVRQPVSGYGTGGRPMAGGGVDPRGQAMAQFQRQLQSMGYDRQTMNHMLQARNAEMMAQSQGGSAGGFQPIGSSPTGPRPMAGGMSGYTGAGPSMGAQGPSSSPSMGGSQWNYGGGYAPSATPPMAPQMPGMPSYQAQEFQNTAQPYLAQNRALTNMFTGMPNPQRQEMQFLSGANALGIDPTSIQGYGTNWGPGTSPYGNWSRSWQSNPGGGSPNQGGFVMPGFGGQSGYQGPSVPGGFQYGQRGQGAGPVQPPNLSWMNPAQQAMAMRGLQSFRRY